MGEASAGHISVYLGGMRTSPERTLEPALPFEVGRTGLASFLLPLLRPRDAKAAIVDADVLTLVRPFGTTLSDEPDPLRQITREWVL